MDNIYIYTYIYIYMHIYIYIYIYNFSVSLISSHSQRPSIYLLLPYKIAFHYSTAWDIVSRIKQVTSGDFLYSYFICNMSIKESRYPHEYSHFKHRSIDIRIDHWKPYHRKSCCLNIADDWLQPYKIMQTIGNSAEWCDDVGTICDICHMSMKESRLPYQYPNSKHSQLIAEYISEIRIIVYLVVWTWQTIEF